MAEHPTLLQTVLDTTDCRGLAEFWRELLGLVYRPGDEPPTHGPDDADWLVLTERDGTRRLAFQLADDLPASTWPEPGVPQQLHLDLTVPHRESLEHQRRRVLALGGSMRLDRSGDEEEPLYAFADPAGHPFCIVVG